MEEKVYRSMGVIGACNLAVGIILIVVGVACGILSIIGGARFLCRLVSLCRWRADPGTGVFFLRYFTVLELVFLWKSFSSLQK